jgi:hypothetical protein
MRAILLALLLVVVVVLGVGFYLGWFHLSARHDAATDQVHLVFDINRGKIEQDAKKAGAPKESHQAKGQVVEIDEATSRLSIRTADEKTLTIQAEPSTMIRRDGVDVGMDSLTQGDRVLVLYREENGKNVAESITVTPGTN